MGMKKADYDGVVGNMRLADGVLFSLPVVLDVADASMIIRKNFGATHFIIGRDMAGTKSTLDSEDFYGAFEAQEMGKKHSAELEVTVVDYPNMVYVGEEYGNARGYMSDKVAKEKGHKIAKLSGTEFRKRLRSGDEIPGWFAFPSVVQTLREGGDSIFL